MATLTKLYKLMFQDIMMLICVGVSATVWRVTGFVASDTAPAFAD